MFTRMLPAALAALFAIGPAVADVVYLKDGKTYEGEVNRQDGKVIVEMKLATITLDADDVLAVQETDTPTAPAEPEIETDEEPEAPGPFTAANATRPEPILFMLTNALATTAPGSDSFELRRQIDRWRILAQDRKRKAGTEWIGPDDFVRHRRAYEKYHDEAHELARDAERMDGDTPAERAKRQRLKMGAAAKFRQAARQWADPMLRTFLLGAAECRGNNYPRAERFFRQCVDEQPRMAAFHQGLAIALAQTNRPNDALAEYVEMFALRPQSDDAAEMVRQAMTQVPGASTKRPAYVRAQEMLDAHESDRRGRRGRSERETWLFPGDEINVEKTELPTPPADRYTFLQAVAVPVATDRLLVDGQLAREDAELFVRIDADTLVPAELQSRRKDADEPLVEISVRGYAFSPIALAEEMTFVKGEAVTVASIGLYEQMGPEVRVVEGEITGLDVLGAVTTVSASLIAGEAAAPIITADGNLAGFLAARTDPQVEGGGADRLIDFETVAEFAGRSGGRSGLYSRRDRDEDRTPEELPDAEGRFFVIYANVGERFGDH